MSEKQGSKTAKQSNSEMALEDVKRPALVKDIALQHRSPVDHN